MAKKLGWRRQEIGVVAAAILVVALSVVVTLWVNGFFFNGWQNNANYRNVTMTDAVLNCENTTRSQFKNRLQHLTLDDLSSRFDQREQLYRVFFNAQLTVPGDSSTHDFYISCLVNAHHGKIKEYEAFQKQEAATEAIRKDDGGLFGWPHK